MNQISEAKAYGMYLGALQGAMQRFAQEVTEGFKLGLTPPERLTPEQLEKRRERLYVSKVQNERTFGRLYVIREVDRIRKELGLPPLR